MRVFGEHVLVLVGHSFDGEGPYLQLADMDAREQVRYHVFGKTFSLARLPQRRCAGRYNLATGKREVCPLNVELPPDSKDDSCPACMEATGFNPSFYYAALVSPQQRAYNETPHYNYLAYFAPGFVKAGISAEARGVRRLLDQGARAARIVGRFENAYDARELEAALCAQRGIYETMRASKKMELLANARFGFEEACRELDAAAAKVDLTAFGGRPLFREVDAVERTDGGHIASNEAANTSIVSPDASSAASEVVASFGSSRLANASSASSAAIAFAKTPLDADMARLGCGAQHAYFDFTSECFGGATAPSCDTMQLVDAGEDVYAGRCVGMVGSTLVLEQGGVNYLASLAGWESHVVGLSENEVLREYDFAPMQMSLL